MADTVNTDTGAVTLRGSNVQTTEAARMLDNGADLPAEMTRLRESFAAQEAKLRASGRDPQWIESQVAQLHASLEYQAGKFAALQGQRDADDAARAAQWRTAVAGK